ncbi:TPA: hypothetical protein N5N51_004418 [Enterobacter hormaechei subsp. xiangfangensis]|uniref:hypothetical protein n=1 Tax=Enterobacter cloacae complex TaxID=354276 RepID=UPI0013308E72|nr:hypothetical protein [Enterobacter roggenkampii]MCM7653690.1 hypothetical protein [Enterobacter hormaechei]HCM9429401.1 hypothetical protein [Enterobacter hormaechei subsp. xiangfangensis]
MLENYLKLLAIADYLRKWRKGSKPPRSGVERIGMVVIGGLAFAFFGHGAVEGANYFFYAIATLLLLYAIYWFIAAKTQWDVQCGVLLKNYDPIDLPAFVELKKAILEHDKLRLEDAESWLIKEMLASQGIADVAKGKAGERYPFLYDTPVIGKGEK